MESGLGEYTSSLFAKSHSFTINGGQFYAHSGSSHGQNRSTSTEHEDVTLTAFRVIPMHKLRMLSVIYTRKGYRFNSAKRKKSDVVVQVFEGPDARQMWQKTLKFSRRLVNAHALNVVGISPTFAASSDPHYIVFDGVGSRNTRHLIASMLRKGARETTIVGSRVVYGIASALDYISKAVLPLADLNKNVSGVLKTQILHSLN
ncbi:hypothetical protein BT96DRAFT_367493 [Gymnopus androsaceus JB14]|uniref:Uncharacterized protein n=1 Tax=Gymnopus androsaceus JB14 TaxID=1447944 RepID=A0A6A4IPV1_9AGAR|nr:hypothetical protein BT96DRAFT_367493 [Gymnopus androsaceus JB14]